MTDSVYVLQQLRIGALVGIYWLIAAAAPFMLFGVVHGPDALSTLLFSVVAAYFSYTGYRAWKRGWKGRFVLRIFVPVVLFLVASVSLLLSGPFT